jgi:hypothetical protein
MQPKARTTPAIKANSARDTRVIAPDEGGARKADRGDGVGTAISVAHLACTLRAYLVPQIDWKTDGRLSPVLRLYDGLDKRKNTPQSGALPGMPTTSGRPMTQLGKLNQVPKKTD